MGVPHENEKINKIIRTLFELFSYVIYLRSPSLDIETINSNNNWKIKIYIKIRFEFARLCRNNTFGAFKILTSKYFKNSNFKRIFHRPFGFHIFMYSLRVFPGPKTGFRFGATTAHGPRHNRVGHAAGTHTHPEWRKSRKRVVNEYKCTTLITRAPVYIVYAFMYV